MSDEPKIYRCGHHATPLNAHPDTERFRYGVCYDCFPEYRPIVPVSEQTVRDLFIGVQNLAVLDILGIDPATPVETVQGWLKTGRRRDELVAEFGEPVRLIHPAPCDDDEEYW